MYREGDQLVHPLHGAGTIAQILRRRVDGKEKSYYVLKLDSGNVRILIPVDGCEAIGVRPVVGRACAEALIAAFPTLDAGSDESWNRRYRENMRRLRSGRPDEVAWVVKALMLRERAHSLSSGERRLLSSAKQILLSELSIALGQSAGALEQTLYALLDA